MQRRGTEDLRERAARLASAGAVGASVAHELRNALAVAESSLFLARRDLDDRARLVSHLDQASAQVRRAQEVIDVVLGLARGDRITQEPVKVTALVDAARGSIVLPTNVTFSVAIDPPDLAVRANVVLLDRLLTNLYLNAIEALATRGRGAITTRAARDGAGVHLVVEDDGPGIDPTIAGEVFDPLVTTKPTGTGLGLALSREIARAHGGDIAVSRALGGGARVEIVWPG